MKKALGFIMLLLIFTLSACEDEEVVIELTLVGDSEVWIKEGANYEDEGVLVNGEKELLPYQSNIDINRLGTYYIEYQHESGVTVTRTVHVIAGAKTEFTEIVDMFQQLTNYSYLFRLDIAYTRDGTEFTFYDYEDYDVYNEYRFGEMGMFNKNSSLETVQKRYVVIDLANKKQEIYAFDEYSYWYYLNPYFDTPNTLFTMFNMVEFTKVTKEIKEDVEIYSVYLEYESYQSAYHHKTNYFNSEQFTFEPSEYVILEVTVIEGNVTSIDVDMTALLNDNLPEHSITEVTKYIFTYEFSNFNSIEEIVLTDEALEAKNTYSD